MYAAGGPNDKVGMPTCKPEDVETFAANLFYYVIGKLVLVLDRQSVASGQVIGLLQMGDVVISNNISGIWVMLPEGSYVRHPQMRGSKLKMKRTGWLLIEHDDYGALLTAISPDLVSGWFKDEAFLKVPLIKPVVKAKSKAKPKAKAAVAAPEPELLEEPSAPEPSSASGPPAEPSTEPSRTALSSSAPDELADAEEKTAAETAAETQAGPGLVRVHWHPSNSSLGDKAPAPKAPAPKAPVPAASEAKSEAPPNESADTLAAAEAKVGLRAAMPPEAQAAALAAAAGFKPLPPTPAAEPVVPASAAASRPPSSAASAPTAKSGAVVSAMVTVGPKAVASAKAKAKAAAKPERLKPENFEDHLGTCKAEHWKIARRYVWVRDSTAPDGTTLHILRDGALVCQGCLWGEPQYSSDGKCITLSQDAKFWQSDLALRPELVITKPELEFAYIQLDHPEVGPLLEYVAPNLKTGKTIEQPVAPERKRLHEPVLSRNPPDFSEMSYWLVGQWGAWIHTECSVFGPVEFKMQPNDILVFGKQPLRLRLDKSGNWWMHVQEGSQVYRRTEDGVIEMLGTSGMKVHGYVLREDVSRTYLKHVLPELPGMIVSTITGYGEPYMVCEDGLTLHSEHDINSESFGVLRKGDVVGLRRIEGKWGELALQADVRVGEAEGDLDDDDELVVEGLNPPGEITMLEGKMPVKDKRFTAQFPAPTEQRRAWVLMTTHYGTKLLERCRGDLEEGCLLTEPRRKLYAEVIGLCHTRIYEENVQSLWEGDRSKLPSRKSLEAKLFDRSTTVLHAARGKTLVGGAIVKECRVKAFALGSSSVALALGKDFAPEEGYPGHTFVGYIDSAAACPNSHAGSALWEVVAKMGFVIVACHPILLQSTVDFWQSRGMKRYDVDAQKDCEDFRTSLLVQTQGKVRCDLADLVEALPPSHLPLFVWLCPRCAELQDDIDGNSRIFVPDDPENYF